MEHVFKSNLSPSYFGSLGARVFLFTLAVDLALLGGILLRLVKYYARYDNNLLTAGSNTDIQLTKTHS